MLVLWSALSTSYPTLSPPVFIAGNHNRIYLPAAQSAFPSPRHIPASILHWHRRCASCNALPSGLSNMKKEVVVLLRHGRAVGLGVDGEARCFEVWMVSAESCLFYLGGF